MEVKSKEYIYNKARKHMLTQGVRATRLEVSVSNSCNYRMVLDGKVLRCGVGCFVKDEDYDECIEGLSMEDISLEAMNRNDDINEFKLIDAIEKTTGTLDMDKIELLREIQGIHDSTEPSNWEWSLDDLAISNGFKTWD